jgi:hypothetical protein
MLGWVRNFHFQGGFKMAKSNKNNQSNVLFRCVKCNFEEQIPKEVVDYFDIMDGGDPSFPPRFDCQACNSGKMQPVHYVNHDGIVYKL